MCLKRIFNISWQQSVSNSELRNRIGQPVITAVLKKRRWTYLGHVLCMKEGRLPWTAYDWKPGDRRRWGRPKNTLPQTFDRDLRTAETSLVPVEMSPLQHCSGTSGEASSTGIYGTGGP